MTKNDTSYDHTQKAPLGLLLYVIAFALLLLPFFIRIAAPTSWTLLFAGLLTGFLAASFQRLSVEDRGDALFIRFGPLPLFRRRIRYQDIVSAEPGRTMIVDGWGIHLSLRGGWVWNIWGRDCVVVRLKNGGVLRIGTDDAENLSRFLSGRAAQGSRPR